MTQSIVRGKNSTGTIFVKFGEIFFLSLLEVPLNQ
jgi:hypothetical protein